MMEAEGILERKRRDLSLRQDFNLPDAFKLFNCAKQCKYGIDCDDFYYVVTKILGVNISRDEIIILFYKIDKDGDGYVNYSEFTNAFLPKQHEYSSLI